MNRICKTILILSITTTLSGLNIACQKITEVQKINDRAVEKVVQKDYQAALNDYKKAIEKNPNDPTLYNNRANAHFQAKNYEKAIEDYNQAIKINPQMADAYYNRAYAKQRLADLKGALSDYEKALEFATDETTKIKIYGNRGTIHHAVKNYQNALNDYAQVIKLQPDLPQIYSNRANLYYQQGKIKQAIADFRKAADLYQQQGNLEYQQQLQAIVSKIEQTNLL
ncbi:MAG: tetratricopeptide repeat protein [Okeania sp. SIO3C4]|nr:tetratricopeptide repeat protein [Okeania sp. SIO3C4]